MSRMAGWHQKDLYLLKVTIDFFVSFLRMRLWTTWLSTRILYLYHRNRKTATAHIKRGNGKGKIIKTKQKEKKTATAHIKRGKEKRKIRKPVP